MLLPYKTQNPSSSIWDREQGGGEVGRWGDGEMGRWGIV